ncbi:MAG TPA: Hsp33 family molecular chaperone HslO [Alphaproteobacteria bacterium]
MADVATGSGDDVIQPFRVESGAAFGRLVRLGPVADRVISQHDYPQPVAALLGEMVALAAMFSAASKFEGLMTVQAKGDGPVRLLVADVTTSGDARGYAQVNAERLERLIATHGPDHDYSVPQLMGAGYLAFTIDQGPDTERYQGIVELSGATLAECAHGYFRQSEQSEAAVKLAAGRVRDLSGQEVWRAGGIMLQRPPRPEQADDSSDAEDEWRRAVAQIAATTDDELLAPALHPHELLRRTFAADDVRVFRPRPLRMHCSCSPQRVNRLLKSFPRGEIESMKINGEVEVVCEFCGRRYAFDDAALERLYAT